MERVILGDPAFYQHQCSCQKFFTGKQEQDVVLSDHYRPVELYSGKIIIQYLFNDGDERPELIIIFTVHGLPG